jgi:hypothetical protein
MQFTAIGLRRCLPLLFLLLASLPGVAFAQATGILEVKANIDGALVFVDGEPLGETPLLEIIAAGRHDIVVSRDGFADWSKRIVLEPDSTAVVTAELKRLAPALEVRVDVADAVVYVDGKEVGTGAVVMVDPVAAGTHRVDVKSPAYGNWSGNVNLSDGRVTPVKVSLRGSLGAIQVSSTPPGALVTVDGSEAGVTPINVEPVKSGSHGIRLSLDGHADFFQAVVVDPGKKVEVKASLTTASGSLDVKPNVTTAKVYVNGVEVGTGRSAINAASPGMYSIRVSAADHTDYLKTVQVEEGKKTTVQAKLEAFDFGSSNRLSGSRPGGDVVKRPGFWAALGGGIGAGVAIAVIAGVAANVENPDPGVPPVTVTPPATDHAFTLP